MKVLILDNFDSFTYNIQHYLESKEVQVEVFRADSLTLDDVRNYDRLILSPGPGLPNEYTFMSALLKEFIGVKPILGVCLGMQAITQFFGGELYNLNEVKHGVQESVSKLGDSLLLKGVPEGFHVGLYHSWACRLNDQIDLTTIAESESGVLMAFENPGKMVFGVQFHPESILTPQGKLILQNFILS